jgi:tRNA dimethylallyltransferase
MADAGPVVALYGATALGKSDVALELAARLEADIVVADSMQVYQGLSIITNQPPLSACRRIARHLVGFVPPQHDYTVAEFASRAHQVIDALLKSGRAVVVEGGSGLYLRAALGDLEFGAPPDAARRRCLEERWERDPAALIAELERCAPDVAARVDLGNPRRVIRALEDATAEPLGRAVAEPTGDRLWQPGERYAHRLFALVPEEDRTSLKQRIDARVDEMLAAGALDEVAAARAAGPFSRTAAQAIGVRELSAVLDGELALDDAAARMKTRTHSLARRQLTWMRKLPAATAVPVTGRTPAAVGADVYHLLQRQSW